MVSGETGGKGTLQTGKVITISSKHASFRAGRRLATIVLTVAAFAALPSLAGAQTIDPSADQYDNTLQQVSQGGTPPCTPGTPSASSAECAPPPSSCEERAAAGNGSADDCSEAVGGLPFTGLDVAALAGVAGFLLLAGIGLRRARFGEHTNA
jgi:hypothetical protein